MAENTEVMPDEYVVDERLRQLYQQLETARFCNKRSIRKVVNHLHLLNAPSTSTFNTNRNNSDTSPRSRVAKDSCEVVSSSHNLKDISKNRISRDNVELIISPTTGELRNRVNSKERTHSSTNVSSRQNRNLSTFEIVSPNRNIARRLQYSPDIVQSRKFRLLINWRVTLDEEYQLRIVGTTESGRPVSSKPIAKRLTCTTVESVCEHLYSLQGNLVDDERELPEYIHDKFYNGFPDDWKKVYKLWKKFVQRGSRTSFPWCTESTDSDEDSETMVTANTCSRDNPEETTVSNFFKRPRKVQPLNFEHTFNVPQSNKDEQNYSDMNDISTNTHVTNTSKKSFRTIAVQTPVEQCFFGKKDCEKRENIFSNCSCAKKTSDEIMSRLDEIIDNLMDERCSPEYMTAIAEMLRFMEYFASFRLKKDEACAKDSNIKQSKCMVQGNNETGSIVRSIPKENCASKVVEEHVLERNIIEKEVENMKKIHRGASVMQKLPSRKSDIDSSSDSLYNSDDNDINSVAPRKDSTTVKSRRSETNNGNLTFTKEKSKDLINSISIGVSSRGRRIVPPLSYWTGERIASINNKPVYSPATSQIVLMNSSSSRKNKSSNKTNTQQVNKHQRNSSRKSKDINANSTKKGTNAADKLKDDSKHSKSYKNVVRSSKRRTMQMQLNDSSDEENIPLNKRHKVDENKDEERNIAGTSKKGSMTFRSQNVVYSYSLDTSLKTSVLSDDVESCI